MGWKEAYIKFGFGGPKHRFFNFGSVDVLGRIPLEAVRVSGYRGMPVCLFFFFFYQFGPNLNLLIQTQSSIQLGRYRKLFEAKLKE